MDNWMSTDQYTDIVNSIMRQRLELMSKRNVGNYSTYSCEYALLNEKIKILENITDMIHFYFSDNFMKDYFDKAKSLRI